MPAIIPRARPHGSRPYAAAGFAALVAGCASLPDVTVAYKRVGWSVGVSVVDTITCTRDTNQAIVVRGATFTPIYRADAAAKPFELRVKDLDRYSADTDLTVNLTDDGRLKSINQSTTGQGEAIAKAAVGAVAAIGAATAGLPPVAGPTIANASPDSKGAYALRNGTLQPLPSSPQPMTICAVVRKWTAMQAKGLPQISVVQTAAVQGSGTLTLGGDKQATLLLDELKKAGLDLRASVTADIVQGSTQPIAKPGKAVGPDDVALELQQTGGLSLKAMPQEAEAEPIGTATVTVPLRDTFVLPIPKAALFGKQSFSLSLADSGRITSIGYGSTTGAPGALNALASVAGVQSAEDAAEAAARQAAADLIAQQSRLSACLLDPANCK